MEIIKGYYGEAKVFKDLIEEQARQQIMELCEQLPSLDAHIRIMPDVHAGMGCTIGTTMKIHDVVVPNLVGVDIGCGMETARIKAKHIEVQRLDKMIRQRIPSGRKIRSTEHEFNQQIDLEALRCIKHANINLKRAKQSLGTLGGGNHFIEANKDKEGNIYLVIHSGSRHLGNEVARYYQQMAISRMGEGVPKYLAFLTGEQKENYLHDMKIVQHYADLNRKAMMADLEKVMKLKRIETVTTIHNYIDLDTMILRKGAVSAKDGEMLLIPMNMRDGSLLCRGKGNEDWNQSAPHGAGRLYSRSGAKETFSVAEFKKSMEGIYTTSVGKNTIDECPMAYKPMESIVKNIEDSVEIISVLKPIYNYKSGE
jgi:tRNA-splicing ligase RtcB